MKGRNPSVGRHNIGAPIARSGTKPQLKRGQAEPASNKITTNARPEYSRSRSSSANDYTRQAQQFIKQAPEPFRNPQASANPKPMQPKDTGTSKAYQPYKGSRVSQAMPTSQPQRNTPAVGISGGSQSGMGSENGKVAGLSQPRRVGDVYNQPRGKAVGGYGGRGGAPSFYGR